MPDAVNDEEPLSTWGNGAAPSDAVRLGEMVLKSSGPWAPSVLSVLRHLERVGFLGAPRVVGSGYSADGRTAVSFVPGASPHPRAWPDEEVWRVGALLRDLHNATASFALELGAQWKPTWLRDTDLGGDMVIGHGDAAPWNIIGQGGRPEVLVDWEFAGPIDRITELAYAVWLNAQLHDDDVAEMAGLPDARKRAAHAHAILDGYQFSSKDRGPFFDRVIELAIHAARAEAMLAHVHPASTEAVDENGFPVLWAITWRARSASWMIRNRRLLSTNSG